MRRRIPWRSTPVVLAVLLVPGALAAQPPKWEIPPESLETRLLPRDIEKINNALGYWADQMRSAEQPAQILATARGIGKVYVKYESPIFRYTVAERAVQIVAPLLDLPHPLKQINTARALQQMHQVSVQPAAERMVAHPNPAVRYYGWQLYREVRTRVLAQGLANRRRMVQSLRKALEKEPSPLVLGAVYQMMTFPPVAGGAAGQQALTQTREAFFEAVGATWQRLCRGVIAGEIPYARTALHAIRYVSNTVAADPDDQDRRRNALQMLVDIVFCAATAYDKVNSTGPVAAEMEEVLRAGEGALTRLTNRRPQYIITPLTDPTIKDPGLGVKHPRGAAVLQGVLNWIDSLQGDGVRQPDYRLPTTTTAPSGE